MGGKASARRSTFEIRDSLEETYRDVYSRDALQAVRVLAHFNKERLALMDSRMKRRAARAKDRERIDFLPADALIGGTSLKVQDARDGKFVGSAIPADLQRQWIQGTGPAARPHATIEKSIRNAAYALLSGADGWMFDGEDALGQVSTMSLDNQRCLALAIHRDDIFTKTAQDVAREMNAWSEGALSRKIVTDAKHQLDFTTVIFRARGLHLDDRHIRVDAATGFSASIVDVALYVVNNYKRLLAEGRSVVLYLPKIQTAEEAALWSRMLDKLEAHLGLASGTIKTYVLIEQLEASFQLMEIRAALGNHFVGFNTGRWDYINSVSDAMAWDSEFINPEIEAIGMTYGYMRNYEDRVRRAVNTPDSNGNFALWQGGMEPNIPVGSERGVAASMEKAIAGARREQSDGASGKWVAHWKMVHIVRPVWQDKRDANQLGRKFPRLTYSSDDAARLLELEPAPRTVAGARRLLSVALQYGNAFAQGLQAVALKPADDFGNDDVLYLMEDMATGEIRLSILWEWLHKSAPFTDNDDATQVVVGDQFTSELFARLLDDEFAKLQAASNRDVHQTSKRTTLPIAKEIADQYVRCAVKPPWYVDLLNVTLGQTDRDKAKQRIKAYLAQLKQSGERITINLDFAAPIANK